MPIYLIVLIASICGLVVAAAAIFIVLAVLAARIPELDF